jgi:squalene-hopene/tetraprenyl-beta-curcumene cyclase
MQVFIRYGFTKAYPYFEEPLEVLLNEQANNDAWETWILPNANKSDEQELQTLWINKAWGTGSDPEVIANLIYALVLFDKQRFANDINRGIQFLLDNHEGQYRWKSTWYYGNYYGTYVAVRALCAANANKSVIEGVINFIEKSRLPNGSWALEGKDGDALQTALALLALSIAKKHLEHSLDKYWLTISYDYLQQTYTTQNGWPSEPFIQMPMGRPIGFVHTILTYESAAITNNYVAKAALHISQNHIL